MAEEREKKRKKSQASSSTAPEPAPARSTQDMKAGEFLHHVRTQKGVELEEVSAAIHVRPAQLRAIEEGHIESLPGMTYALGFVKSYATYLKLDPISLANKFKAEHSAAPARQDLKFPEPISEHKMPDLFMIGAGVAGVAVLLGAWLFFSGGEEKTATNVATAIPAPPTEIAPLTTAAPTPAVGTTTGTTTGGSILTPVTPATGTAATPASNTTTAAAAPAAATTAPGAKPGVPATAPATTAGAATSPATAVPGQEGRRATLVLQQQELLQKSQQQQQWQQQQAAAAQAAQQQQAQLPPAQQETINIRPGRGRVMLEATQSTWVQVTDSGGAVVLKRVLRPGDRYYVPDQPGLSMVTSNAGGLDVFVDGRPARSIGNSGEIVRGVSLSPDNLGRSHTRNTVHD